MTKSFKWAMLGDLQIPYHDKRAVALALKAIKAWKPDAIDVLGDISDFLEFSSFSDGTTDEFFNILSKNKKANEKELTSANGLSETYQFAGRDTDPLPFLQRSAKDAKVFYTDLRDQHKNADIHVSRGNHEERIFKYLDKKAPEYLEELTPNFLWGFDDLGMTWRAYHEKPYERFAGIHVHHGSTTTSSGLAVKSDIENYNISLIRGHDHRGGVVYKTYPMSEKTLVGMGAGHLCDPAAYGLRYADNPAWEQGFGIGHIYEGKPWLTFVPIQRTEQGLVCMIDGKLFTE